MTDTQHASAIGSPIEDLDTPALLLDWDISESNLKRMTDDMPQAVRLSLGTSTWPDDQVALADTSPGETWTCVVSPDDGEDVGTADSVSVELSEG